MNHRWRTHVRVGGAMCGESITFSDVSIWEHG